MAKLFRNLRADEIEVRIAQTSKEYTRLLLYKTARVDMDLLDETFGAGCWQNKYELINGNLFCSIGIKTDQMTEWIWKTDCGVESQTEKEKGESSDAFKRAGFRWGIGRELYTAPVIAVLNDQIGGVEEVVFNGKKSYKLKNPYTKFCVSSIEYDKDNNISHVCIKTTKGLEVYKK